MRLFDVDMLSGFDTGHCVLGMGSMIRSDENNLHMRVVKNLLPVSY
jgi:hypothetical protein